MSRQEHLEFSAVFQERAERHQDWNKKTSLGMIILPSLLRASDARELDFATVLPAVQ